MLASLCRRARLEASDAFTSVAAGLAVMGAE
jgi:hypothetical protein